MANLPSRVINISPDNYLILVSSEITEKMLIEKISWLVQGHVELVKKDSVFIDIGSLVPGNGVEHLISIASIKLMVEADTVFIQIDYRLPLTWQKLKTEKDHFINGEVALREAIEDIVAQVMVAIDTYKRVVPHGC